MKQLFAESITPESGRIIDFFQILQIDRKAKKDGSPYLALKLGDRTGSFAAKLWEIPEGFDPKAGDVVKAEGDASSYREQLQVTIKRIRIAEPGEWEKGDYIPASAFDRDKLLEVVYQWIASIDDEPLKYAMIAVFAECHSKLREAPAAKKLHQAYLGGLCEHITNLCELASRVCCVYPELNKDILIAAAFIHDIGKIEEYCYDTHIGDTRSGRLIGHIIQGSLILERACVALEPATRDHLAHIIASHHGNLEWGAARVPMTREAQVFHLLDMIDSRMGICSDALNGPVDEDGFTAYIPALETALWNAKGTQS